VLNVIVLVLSSFTEHLWTWDRFLRGGQDFELSLLALLAFCCLILVLAQHLRRTIDSLLDSSNRPSYGDEIQPSWPVRIVSTLLLSEAGGLSPPAAVLRN
jgi:hypothetical protein